MNNKKLSRLLELLCGMNREPFFEKSEKAFARWQKSYNSDRSCITFVRELAGMSPLEEPEEEPAETPAGEASVPETPAEEPSAEPAVEEAESVPADEPAPEDPALEDSPLESLDESPQPEEPATL